MQHLAERRYRVDDEIVEEYRRAVGAARASAPANYDLLRPEWTLVLDDGFLAMALTWHGDLAEARQAHEQALAIAERQGSPVVRGVELVELAVTAMRRGDVEVVRELAPAGAGRGRRRRVHAVLRGLRDGTAGLGRLARRAHGRCLGAGDRGARAWDPHPHSYPDCLALWPLAGAYLDAGQVPEAVGAVRRLLEPSHARLPDELEAAVQEACEAWDRGEPELAGRLLADAVQLARDLGYA